MNEIIVAFISGGLALIGVIIANNASNKKISENVTAKLEKAQAVTDTKIEELTREVRLHNGFAEKIPVMQEQIRVANHRITDLEDAEKRRYERNAE